MVAICSIALIIVLDNYKDVVIVRNLYLWEYSMVKPFVKFLLLVIIVLCSLGFSGCDSTAAGLPGERGADGLTPTIGENGNWWVGDNDTGVAATITSGGDNVFFTAKCGDNARWTMFNDGKLVISGTGAIDDKKLWLTFNKLITEVTVNDGITNIPSNAFENCENLTKVIIPQSVIYIGYGAFSGCSSLINVTLGDNVTDIGDNAFYNCSVLTEISIGNAVTNIGNNAFYNCSSLKELVFPDSITRIGENAFNGCIAVERVYFQGDVFSWCKISFGQGSNPLRYAHNLFINNEIIKEVSIPNTITSIGTYVFDGWNGISVSIPDCITTIGEGAFSGCKDLTKISLPNTLTYIGRWAFSECIAEIIWGENPIITSIGESAFNSYRGTKIEIPISITNIGSDAFRYCSNLKDITYQGTKEQWGAIQKGWCWNELTGNYTIHCSNGDISK